MKPLPRWHDGPTAWGPALIAGLGCALPLLLGLFSAHPGFLWAAAGAFQAAQANPLHRFGMLRLLLLTGLGACSAGLGFSVRLSSASAPKPASSASAWWSACAWARVSTTSAT